MSDQPALRKILIAAGGTGGHIFPALAIARTLQQQGVTVYWLGSAKGLESQLIPAANIPIYYLDISGLRGKGLIALLKAPWKLLIACRQAIKVLKTVQPNVVLGMGGFASGPAGIAAWLTKHPLVIHEQNAVLGLTNRWLAKLAKRVLEAFPDTFPATDGAIYTGNPIRAEILTLKKFPLPPLHSRSLRVLVLGGSLGAQAINLTLPQALAQWPSQTLVPEVWHQTGQSHLTATETEYQRAAISAKLVPFITNMAEAYVWADIAICRAGALTVAELAAVGLPSILIPFPHAVDDHQTRNAEYLVKAGAAILLPQSELTAKSLCDLLHSLATDPMQLTNMAKAASQLKQPDAAQQVASHCAAVAR